MSSDDLSRRERREARAGKTEYKTEYLLNAK